MITLKRVFLNQNLNVFYIPISLDHVAAFLPFLAVPSPYGSGAVIPNRGAAPRRPTRLTRTSQRPSPALPPPSVTYCT